MSGATVAVLLPKGATGVINGAIPGGSQATTALFVIANDGTYVSPGGAGNWVTPATAVVAAQYQVRVDETSGAFSSGPVGTWFDCSTLALEWAEDAGGVTFTLSFREKASQVVRSVQTGITVNAI